MQTKTTADIRKADELTGSFILNKMKQGRDQIIKQKFVVVEVADLANDKDAVHMAIEKLKEEL